MVVLQQIQCFKFSNKITDLIKMIKFTPRSYIASTNVVSQNLKPIFVDVDLNSTI